MVTPLNNSVMKAFAILDLLDDSRQQISARDVADLVGLNAVTAHRFLKTLTATGVLVSPKKGVFRLGNKLVDYGERAKSFRKLAVEIQPFLNRLADETGESAMATTFDGTMITCIAAAHSDKTFLYNARVGARMEAYATANGKLWLAFSDPSAWKSYLAATDLSPFSQNTIVDPVRLQEELDEIRVQGIAFNRAEREDSVAAIAIPILTADGRMIAGMSVYGPTSHFTEDTIRSVRSRLAKTHADIVSIL
ncbi:IclR family transcriptional regulator [Rhizobium halophytocola]|uniref:DNA-binding IclR family transcriptional regulator n=1 Tax=Rhizobium halophytocola TaxID=735519 RepID=A0ABS4DST3_9HYPH|nr:IclR family transcriptional regulator [Rhizobium halophytocola]MBP1848758.1 DNA-binding IclR family transcriptional regulator [Rhizobium halophytocola]